MPADLFYSTGQVAEQLGVSADHIRRLCQAGAITAGITSGGQLRISQAEVDRLKKNGLPPLPRPLPNGDAPPPRSRHGHPALLADPSDEVVEAAEQVAITENLVKKRKLERELEETEDWFRERDEREAELAQEREQQEMEQQEQQRKAHETAQAAQRRQEWKDGWLNYALRSMPWDAPRETRLDVHRAVEETLERLQPSQPNSVVRPLVDAAIERALAPWRRRKEIEEAIQEAADSLPTAARGWFNNLTPWQLQARQAAAAALEKLRSNATTADMRAIAKEAVQPIIRRFEHERACKELVETVWGKLRNETSEDREHGKAAVKAALEALPVGPSQREMEQARDKALAGVQASIDARHEREKAERERQRDQETRKAVIADADWRLTLARVSDKAKQNALAEVREALAALPGGTARVELDAAADPIVQRYKRIQERKETKAQLIEAGLQAAYPYLSKLQTEDRIELEQGETLWSVAEDMKHGFRSDLERELDGAESAEEVAKLVRRWVREELGL